MVEDLPNDFISNSLTTTLADIVVPIGCGLSTGVVVPVTRSLSAGIVVPAACGLSGAAVVPSSAAANVFARRLLAADLGMPHLLAVVAFDTAIIARLGAFFAHVASTIAVAANHHSLIRTVGLAMTSLIAIEANAASAAVTALGRFRTISLLVPDGFVSNRYKKGKAQQCIPRRSTIVTSTVATAASLTRVGTVSLVVTV
jgi:hypothetical protein